MDIVYKILLDYFREIPGLTNFSKPLSALSCIIIILVVAGIAHILTRQILVRFVSRIARKTKTDWDDILVKNKVFRGLAHLIPAFIIFYTSDFSYPELLTPLSELDAAAIAELSKDYYLGLTNILFKLSKIYFVFIIIFVANSVLNSAMEIYNTTEYAHHRPIKGYVQLLKILVAFMSAIMIISILLERDPTVLLAGLGAIAAILLLVFKDTILGFVASIQLSANNMVKIGDWIEMKSHGADGTVLDITLKYRKSSKLG